MILAGEIGATRTRLAAYEKEGSRLRCGRKDLLEP